MDPIAIAGSAINVLNMIRDKLEALEETFEEAAELKRCTKALEVTLLMIPSRGTQVPDDDGGFSCRGTHLLDESVCEALRPIDEARHVLGKLQPQVIHDHLGQVPREGGERCRLLFLPASRRPPVRSSMC